MLWYKGWIETRYRVLFLFVITLFLMVFIERNTNTHSPASRDVEKLLNNSMIYLLMIPIMLGGAGIKTQPLLRTTKGLHGSMYFTLSLPVSRLRLVMTRAGLGLLETVGVLAALTCLAWFIFPALKVHLTGADMFAYWGTISVCMSGFYFLSVFFATLWDDVWQIWGSFIVVLILRWLVTAASFPSPINIFGAMVGSSPLFTHTLPWASMGISLTAAAILFLSALKVVQTREF